MSPTMRTFSEAAAFKHTHANNVYLLSLVSPKNTNSEDHSFAYIASDDSLNTISVSVTSPPFIIQVKSVPKAHDGISCLVAVPEEGLATAGRDGKVKLWSLAADRSMELTPGLNVSTPNSQGVSALAIDAGKKLIAAGTESEKEGVGDVAIYIWSYNYPKTPQLIRSYTESHNDTLTSLHFYHAQPSSSPGALPALTLISSSTDALVSILDLTQSEEDDALITVFNNMAAVSHVCPFLVPSFYQKSSTALAPALCAISHDEKLSVYEVEGPPVNSGIEVEVVDEEDLPPVWPDLDIRESLAADYAICLTPRQSRERQNANMILAVGAYRPETTARIPGVEQPTISLFAASPKLVNGAMEGFSCIARLIGAHGEEIVRDIWFDEDAGVALTCGEDGYLRLWVDSNAKSAEARGDDVEMERTSDPKGNAGKTDKEGKRKQKRKAERHKPY